MKYFILGFISTLTMLIATDRVLLKNYKEQEGQNGIRTYKRSKNINRIIRFGRYRRYISILRH